MSIARRWLVFLFICSYFSFACAQPEPIKLWPKGAPGAEGNVTPETVRLNPDGEHILSNIQEPRSFHTFPPGRQPERRSSSPQAGAIANYGWITKAMPSGEWLSSHGVAAFVLKYRLAKENDSNYTVEGTELADMQRAIRTVRSRSKEWGIDPGTHRGDGLLCRG